VKPWYLQRTTWAGLALVISGVGTWLSGGDKSEAVTQVLSGLGFIFLRQSTNGTTKLTGEN